MQMQMYNNWSEWIEGLWNSMLERMVDGIDQQLLWV